MRHAGRQRRVVLAIAAASLLAIGGSGVAGAQEPVTTVDWTTIAPVSGEVVDGSVRVAAGEAGGTFPLIAIDVPDLGRDGYAIRGRVRYTAVDGAGFLEMWSVFADGGRYFSRTLGTDGTMAMLTGSSDWRIFELPFFLQGSAPPVRLEINVVLPAGGSVDVGSLELDRLPGAAGAAGSGWLPDQAIGLVGAVVGTGIGLFGALVGALASRGRGRRFVLPAMTAAVAVGAALIVAGILAIPAGQPPSIVFLLLLAGAALAGAFGAAIPRARRAYAEVELRRIRAMDQG